MKGEFTYIITNYTNSVLYTCVTSDIVTRTIQHKESHYPKSFTSKYKCFKLVYFEFYEYIESAIEQEKYIKGKSRKFKQSLIEKDNSDYNDLWEKIKEW